MPTTQAYALVDLPSRSPRNPRLDLVRVTLTGIGVRRKRFISPTLEPARGLDRASLAAPGVQRNVHSTASDGRGG